MPVRCTLIVVALTVLVGWPGCADDRHVVCYEPPVSLEDLAPGLPVGQNQFQLLADESTVGRFACALAIGKYVPPVPDDGGPLRFVALTPAEQAWWTEQMRGVTAIRELVFLRPISARPDGQSVAALCAAAARLQASLVLLYAPGGLGPNSAEVVGVLYEAATRKPLATFHTALAIPDEEGRQQNPSGLPGDHREDDARYQAQRQFERQVLACLRELIVRDQPPATTQPHKWEKPLIERWWLPTR